MVSHHLYVKTNGEARAWASWTDTASSTEAQTQTHIATWLGKSPTHRNLSNIFYHVTSPLHESRLLWIHDPHLSQTSPVPASHLPASRTNNTLPRINDTVPRSNITVPRSNLTVPKTHDKIVRKNCENGPRNGPAPGSASGSSDVRVHVPLDNVSNSASGNHSLSPRVNNCPPVPRNNETDRQTDIRKNVSPRPKKKREERGRWSI